MSIVTNELETKFQNKVKKEIRKRLPGSIILKNDPSSLQGVPDLIILFDKRWATLECKADKKKVHQPNQDYYVDKMNQMSFSAFIYPENKEEVLDAMERSLKDRT